MASTRGMLWLAVITLALGAASARDITALKVVSQRALKQAGPSSQVWCENDTVNLSCATGTLTIVTATYGRTDTTTCSANNPPQTLATTSCNADVSMQPQVAACNGQAACSFPSSFNFDPCGGIYKYTTVQWTCGFPSPPTSPLMPPTPPSPSPPMPMTPSGTSAPVETMMPVVVTMPSPIVTMPMPPMPIFLGCYHDYTLTMAKMGSMPAQHKRAFPTMIKLAKNNATACAAYAAAAGSTHFGMEAGVECWYGNAMTTHEGVTSQGTHNGACTVACPGDKTHKTKCGGKGGAISIFMLE
ncbi:MAG: hypothetical protein WDW38_003807 [Sanguina aurantia]